MNNEIYYAVIGQVEYEIVIISEADIIYINGFDLEENLLEVIETNATGEIIEVSEGILPVEFDEDEHEHDEDEHEHDEDEHHHEHGEFDPTHG